VLHRFEDDLNSRRLKAGLQVDARATWRIRADTEVYASLDNVGDGRLATGQTADGVTSYGQPRTFRVGLSIRR